MKPVLRVVLLSSVASEQKRNPTPGRLAKVTQRRNSVLHRATKSGATFAKVLGRCKQPIRQPLALASSLAGMLGSKRDIFDPAIWATLPHFFQKFGFLLPSLKYGAKRRWLAKPFSDFRKILPSLAQAAEALRISGEVEPLTASSQPGFLDWYRKFIRANASSIVCESNERMDSLQEFLPTFVRIWKTAAAQAEQEARS